MARTITTTTTAEQRHAQAEVLQESIADQVEQLRHSDQWQRFLDFAQAFHPYRLNNLLLILAQCPTATHVAGFRKWQSLNRQVRKGERGIRIFGFRQKKITSDPAEGEEITTDDSGQKTVTYYPMLSVFDLAQTDIIDPDITDPQVITQRLTGDDPAGILTATTDYLHGLGWTVEHQPIPGDTNGYTTMDGSRQVIIDADLSPAQAAKTALHEAAHVLLHADEEHADYIEHRGARETEAESVAYIVAGILQLDTTAYSIGYVASWSHGDIPTIKATAARVLRTAHTLADALTDTDTNTDVEVA